MTGNLIEDKVRNYQQYVAFQSQQQPQTTVTQPQAGTQTVDTTPQADTFDKGEKSDNKKPLIILASWLGLNKLTGLFNKGCTGDNYDKTIVGRLGNFGDKMAKKGSSNKTIKSVKAAFNTMNTNIKNYINKKPMLSAMFNTPTKPENSSVKGFMETQQAADLSEASRTISGYLDEMPKSFKEAGATKAEMQALKAKYGTNIFGGIKHKKRALQELQFNRIGHSGLIDTLSPDKIAETLKELKIKHLGLDPKTYKKVLEHPDKNAKIITEACKRGGKNAKAFFGRFSWIPGMSLITKRSTNLSMSYNKLLAETKHVTKLGRGLARGSKLFMRGLTLGGGKLGTLMVAYGLGTALYNAVKAPKEQKVGTAVAGGVEAVSWIASMPIAIKMIHSVSGLQYTGLSKMQVGRYRVALKNFNKTAKAGGFATQAAYDTALAAVNNLKKVSGTQSKLTKLMVKLGKGLGVALENPVPFKEATKALKGGAKMSAISRNLKRALPLLGKNAIGYPLRFALYIAVFSPIVDKLISSVTSAIFGKPYEPEETEDKDKDKQQPAEAVQQQPVPPEQPVKPAETTAPKNVNKPLDVEELPDDNLIKRGAHGEKIMNEPEDRYIPSEKCEIEGIVSPNDKEDRSYIPNESAPAIQSNYSSDKATVDAAIARANKAEARALEALNGIY